ncbi:Uncharacterised protein [Candidatus Anstonella stagnisolia]|nr:Uncharacterised protein [Candidatus Anstonella stagnisolia]
MDFTESLKYSLSALKEKKLYPTYLVFMAVCALLYLCIYAVPSLVLLFTFLFAFILWYFAGKFIHYKLSVERLAKGKYTHELYLRYMSSIFMQMLHVFFFWRDKKLLLLYLVPIIGAILLFSSLPASAGVSASSGPLKAKMALEGALPGLLFIITGLLALMLMYVFHSYRLCFMPLIKLCAPQKDLGLCSQGSWDATHNKFLAILAYVICFTICAGIPIVLISCVFALVFPNQLMQRALDGALSAPFYAMHAFLLVYIYKNLNGAKKQPGKGTKRKKGKKITRR